MVCVNGSVLRSENGCITSRVFARAGLLGNPSDGYGGKTISVSVGNFFAEVTLCPSQQLLFLPNPEADVGEFDSLESFALHIAAYGYYGGIPLMQATCCRFWFYCRSRGIVLDPEPTSSSSSGTSSRNFSLSYSSCIPRQRGLAGSSAIAAATLNCLMAFYSVADQVPVADRPQLVLSAELDLGIAAGLQDRVVQVYGGLLYMDFDPASQAEGHGVYTSLDPGLLPPLYLIYSRQPSGKHSGSVHTDVKRRWAEGDIGVRQGMRQLAELAEQGKDALLRRDHGRVAELMRRNFEIRRQIFGDAAVGAANLRLVEVATSVGAAAKLPGSGGAALVLCHEGPAQVERLQDACQHADLVCEAVDIGPLLHTASA